MAVILTPPTASCTTARRPRSTIRNIPLPRPRPFPPRAAPGRARALLLAGFVPLLLMNASWDAVTFLGGTGAHALPAHASASACA